MSGVGSAVRTVEINCNLLFSVRTVDPTLLTMTYYNEYICILAASLVCVVVVGTGLLPITRNMTVAVSYIVFGLFGHLQFIVSLFDGWRFIKSVADYLLSVQ